MFDSPFLIRYVDDIILAVPNDKIVENIRKPPIVLWMIWFLAVPNDKIDQKLEIFKGFNENLQFTDVDNIIQFLDTILIRTKDNFIITKWYRKQMSSGT